MQVGLGLVEGGCRGERSLLEFLDLQLEMIEDADLRGWRAWNLGEKIKMREMEDGRAFWVI